MSMIPKIIHYCWFGGKPKPQKVLDYIDGWRRVNPDYEIKEWNETNFDVNSCHFTKESYALGCYAFVSDVARIYALIRDGGIYLDTDVEAIKPFDSLLNDESFIGLETPYRLGTACIGAVKSCQWLMDFYSIYTNPDKHLITKKGGISFAPNTVELTAFLGDRFPKNDGIRVYDVDVLCAKLYSHNGQLYKTERTVVIHHFAGSWINSGRRIYPLFERIRNLKVRYL